MIQNLPIIVNGVEKFASGITKDTTVDDVKFAMLCATDSSFTPDMIYDYGVFLEYQQSENLLEGSLKIYKIVRSLQNQLEQVKFLIKKRISISKSKQQEKSQQKAFKFCSLSPSVQKTWNESRLLRKSSFVKKQFEVLNQNCDDNASLMSIPTSAWSSDRDEESDSENRFAIVKKRYASIKQLNQARNACIKKTSESEIKIQQIDQLRAELKSIKEDFKCKSSKTNQIDSNLTLKHQLIQSLEYELNQIGKLEDVKLIRKNLPTTNSSSSIKSTDSGVSCAYSEDEICTATQLETLV